MDNKERLKKSHSCFSKSIQIHRKLGNRVEEGRVHRALGDLLLDHGKRNEGIEHYRASLFLLRAEGETYDEAITLGNLGLFYLEEKDLENARYHLDASVVLCEELQVKAQGYFMCALAEVLARQGDHKNARLNLKQGESIVYAKEEDKRLIGLTQCHHGHVARLGGHMEEAKKTLQKATSFLDDVSRGAGFELEQSVKRLEMEIEKDELPANG